jgi:hypothetical protein
MDAELFLDIGLSRTILLSKVAQILSRNDAELMKSESEGQSVPENEYTTTSSI